eukprot:1189149-Prorocentrum_minimum.AAC.3
MVERVDEVSSSCSRPGATPWTPPPDAHAKNFKEEVSKGFCGRNPLLLNPLKPPKPATKLLKPLKIPKNPLKP